MSTGADKIRRRGNDEFTELRISPQWRYQLRNRAAGLCQYCQRLPLDGMTTCEKHWRQASIRRRNKTTKRCLNTKSSRALSK
jgi:hypothetical protein